MSGRIPIEAVSPVIEHGRLQAKAVVGELLPITATVYREGHDAVGCEVTMRDASGDQRERVRMTSAGPGTDRWYADVRFADVGAWSFAIEAFGDPYLSWCKTITAKVTAGQDADELANDLIAGARLMTRARRTVPKNHRRAVLGAAEALRDEDLPVAQRVAPALALAELLWEFPVRELVTRSPRYPIWVDRERALYGSWYQMFPRSEGTFTDAARRLPAIAAMGFDVLYLPPVHPIGRVNRKGRDNALTAEEDDVGSPWAIGATEGGHDAIHPDLGTAEDFRNFVREARRSGLEVAMDLALQCAPDHPWVKEHPDWFTTRADGSIAYAENPPKKYEDIYPINFDNDPVGIRAEVLRVVMHWVGQGISIFRVDNPHTKPLNFWEWLIDRVRAVNPEVLFLAEAFTRPAMLHGLGKIGFSQSYTYFTWRTTASELREYCTELVASADHLRPNFWPSTADILAEPLQSGGPAAFKIRAVLASLLSPSWGVYSGYELCENSARPGREEYADSEKYQIRTRDWGTPRGIGWLIGDLNRVRRQNPALHRLTNLRFHEMDNDEILCWSKRDPDSDNTVLVVCSLDPRNPQWGNTTLDMPALGLGWDEPFTVRDELTGAEYQWGQHNAVWLDPRSVPAHVFTVRRH